MSRSQASKERKRIKDAPRKQRRKLIQMLKAEYRGQREAGIFDPVIKEVIAELQDTF